MVDIPDGEDLQARISQWSQGDYVLGDQAMLWGYHPERPLTDISKDSAQDAIESSDMALAGEIVEGLVVLSQTCDIVRNHWERPYIQVAPIVTMPNDAAVRSVQRKSQPRYAFLPALAGTKQVVDLDRIFTIEKSFLAIWDRLPGCNVDEDRRSFTETIKRYYTRPAFPNTFVKSIEGLKNWIHDKHDRNSEMGSCVQALEMILVKPDPSWEASFVTVEFTLVRGPKGKDILAKTWETFVDTCKSKLLPASGFSCRWSDWSLEDLPAKLYLESDVLDLEFLSDETRRKTY